MNAKTINAARAALDDIDNAKNVIRKARNEIAEAEGVINTAIAKLYAFFATMEVK